MTPDIQRTAELWRSLVILHNTAKAHIIYCEEMDLGSRTFIQPRNELCNALEHLMRAKASELGLKNGGPDEHYIYENLEAALGHEYRAFFDVCDWLSVQLRKKIRLTLEPYSVTALNAAVPDYYKEVRPQLEQITIEIAAVRGGKDIAVKGDLLQEVERYNVVIERLKAFATQLPTAVAALEGFKQKEAETVTRLDACARHAKQLRDEICAALEPYSQAAISAALPDYYKEIRLQMEQLILDIAATREASALVADESVEREVERYNGELDKLRSFIGRLPAGMPVMDEVKRKEARVLRGTQVWDVLKIAAAALLAAVLAWYGRGFLAGY